MIFKVKMTTRYCRECCISCRPSWLYMLCCIAEFWTGGSVVLIEHGLQQQTNQV